MELIRFILNPPPSAVNGCVLVLLVVCGLAFLLWANGVIGGQK